ncbi:unnamed protein product [Acanthoscelides obtectus]|uniref:Uncharacterized protein n=1 Tax=Acanthoscelides obtectus TaxID=200917 RepID=A0A9P0KHH2_ACAOB|nr:unnamed protein product [Acanthoscelides obtectus]CAK1647674.1 hypothetical protein AOBTE_LOCUS15331 [Acanthoscelides obtectus]
MFMRETESNTHDKARSGMNHDQCVVICFSISLEQLLLSKCKRLNEMIKSNVTPMYEKVNDLLSTPHNRVSKKNEISIEHKKELDETSSVDEIQRIVNYKMMGYTLLNGAPKSMITDLRLSS